MIPSTRTRSPATHYRHRKSLSLMLLVVCLFLQVNMALAGCLTQPLGQPSALIDEVPAPQDASSSVICDMSMSISGALCKAQCDADNGAGLSADLSVPCPPPAMTQHHPMGRQAVDEPTLRPLPPRSDPIPVYLDSARLRV